MPRLNKHTQARRNGHELWSRHAACAHAPMRGRGLSARALCVQLHECSRPLADRH